MPAIAEAFYTVLDASSTFAGKVYRDRPPGPSALPYAIVFGPVAQRRQLDLDGALRVGEWRIDIVDDDGTSSQEVEALAESCAALFDEDPGLSIPGYIVCGCSSQGPTDLPPDAETYGRSVLVTLWLDKE